MRPVRHFFQTGLWQDEIDQEAQSDKIFVTDQSGKYVHRFYRVYATRRVISPISPCYLVRPGE